MVVGSSPVAYSFMLEILSKHGRGFPKGYFTQHCLSTMLEKWKPAVNKGKPFNALLADLSKTIDYLYHELLLAKLHPFGFSIASWRLIHSYLTNRNH